MKVPSEILSFLLHHAGDFPTTEPPGVVEVPAIASPVIEVPAALGFGFPSALVTAQDHTWMTSIDMSLTNGAQITTNLARLRPGLWKIHVSLGYSANFFAVASGGGVFLTMGTTGDQTVMCGPMSAVGAQYLDVVRVMSLDRDVLFTAFLDTNGVGQTHNLRVGFQANKML